jgi:hypothetical protein
LLSSSATGTQRSGGDRESKVASARYPTDFNPAPRSRWSPGRGVNGSPPSAVHLDAQLPTPASTSKADMTDEEMPVLADAEIHRV